MVIWIIAYMCGFSHDNVCHVGGAKFDTKQECEDFRKLHTKDGDHIYFCEAWDTYIRGAGCLE